MIGCLTETTTCVVVKPLVLSEAGDVYIIIKRNHEIYEILGHATYPILPYLAPNFYPHSWYLGRAKFIDWVIAKSILLMISYLVFSIFG